MTTDLQDADYSHNAWLVLMHRDPMAAAMAAHLLRKERDEAVQALADVRTLDAAGNWKCFHNAADTWSLFVSGPLNPTCETITGATPDEARAKAAAWVRGLK